ncbi:ABC transporter permease [Paenibacillus guangzhouensis]|uniref:ABC transporter permease n=1 Tax=Paenibacillus guangzhouensis TaxID=1473112 RepID=UPI001D104BB9|nr:ABC transporter permease subunit [Paenibacillus guangzhouensis]
MARTGPIQNKIMLLVCLPLLIWIAAFELLPIAGMLVMSFQDDSGQGFSLGQYIRTFTSDIYLQAIWNSLKVALISSVVGIIIALVCGYAITRLSEGFRDRMLMVSNMITNFVGVPLAFAYMIMLGNNGAFTLLFQKLGLESLSKFDLYTENGLLLLYIYYQIPLAILLVYPIFHGIREEWKEASALLGASAWRFWRHIGIPMMLPSILGTFSILIANALGAYATAYALTGSNFNLLSIRIAALVSGDIFPNFQLGSALAVILAIIMLLAMFLNEWMTRYSRRRGL